MFEKIVELFKNPDSFPDIVLSFQKIIEDTYPEIRDFVRRELRKVVDSLVKLYRPVNFPYEVIPVPSIKFTKKPLVEWSKLQEKDIHDHEVIRLRRTCSRLGILVNHQFILKGFVIVDLDVHDCARLNEIKHEVLSKTGNIWDVETRRGFQKIFYLPGLEGVLVKYRRGGDRPESAVFWTTIHIPELKVSIEVKSTRRFLGTFPEASHYLDVVNNRLVARKYRALSIPAQQFAYSCSVELLKAKPEDVQEFVMNILEKLSNQVYRSLRNVLIVEGVDKERFIELSRTVRATATPPDTGEYSLSIGTLTYEELKRIVRKYACRFPNCVRIAVLKEVHEGFCYAFARLASTFLFYIVRPTKEEVEKIAKDFASRFKSFKSPKLYYWEYFGFGLKPVNDRLGYPTKFGIGVEVFDILKQYAKCDQCPFNNICIYYLYYVHGEKRGLTVRQIVINILRGLLR